MHSTSLRRPVLLAAFLLLGLCTTGSSQTSASFSGRELLDECLARLPADPLIMRGWISMRRPRGMVAKEFDFMVELDLGETPPIARYTVSERNGPVLERVIVRHTETSVDLLRMTGPGLEPAEPPAWNDRIQGSDVTWLDVTLGFLWWRNPTLVGEETVRGQLCDILDVFPPEPVPNCGRVRLWLDRDLKMLLQAAEFDPENRLTRQMWVRAVRKLGDGKRWMVRDLEVESRGSGHRTRLHIAELIELATP